MAITALHAAASGLTALSTQLDVIANNLANVNTDGFKASRVNFEDLIYQVRQEPGVENALGDQRFAGTLVGTGVRVSNTQLDFRQGEPRPTGRELDLTVQGKGFFRVQSLPDQGDGFAYTRAGNFAKNSDGVLVLGNGNGPRLEPEVQIPDNATGIEIDQTGRVFVFTNDNVDPQEIGQLVLHNFVNPAGLKQIGANLMIETPASGPPVQGEPGEGQFGTVLQRFLESSNAKPVEQLVDLIKAQRAFEMNSQTIQAADQTLQVVSNLRRS